MAGREGQSHGSEPQEKNDDLQFSFATTTGLTPFALQMGHFAFCCLLNFGSFPCPLKKLPSGLNRSKTPLP